MGRSFWQPADGLNQILLCEFLSVCQSSAQEEFSESRTTRHCGHTAFGLKPDLNYLPLANVRADTEHIPTSRILHFDRSVTAGKLSGMSRVLEVI